MIKYRKDDIIILGLSDKNVELLTSDKPMKIDMAQLGIPGIKLFIVHGKDEDALLKTFKETFGDGTEVIDHRQ